MPHSMTNEDLQDLIDAGDISDFRTKIKYFNWQYHQRGYTIKTGGSINFTTLPREIRDQIFGLALVLHRRTGWAEIDKNCLRKIESRRHDNHIQYAFGVLSTKASTSAIAAEAREAFYRKNLFKLHLGSSSDIQDFLSRPCWSIARSYLKGYKVEPEDLNEVSAAKLTHQLNLLLNLPHMEKLQIYIGWFTKREHIPRPDLRRALTVVTDSCTQLQANLGDNLSFEICQDIESTNDPEPSTLIWRWCSMARVRTLCNELNRIPPVDLRRPHGSRIGHEDERQDDFARAASVGVRSKT